MNALPRFLPAAAFLLLVGVCPWAALAQGPLPPGEYLIAALTDLDPDTWQTPAFLDQVVPAAIKIAIGEGETKTQNLRIAR